MIISVGFLVVGLALLTLAADRFVVSAAHVSAALGLSPILIGALVIGLGTSPRIGDGTADGAQAGTPSR